MKRIKRTCWLAQTVEGPVHHFNFNFTQKNDTSICIGISHQWTKCSIIVINKNWLILKQLCIVHTYHRRSRFSLASKKQNQATYQKLRYYSEQKLLNCFSNQIRFSIYHSTISWNHKSFFTVALIEKASKTVKLPRT